MEIWLDSVNVDFIEKKALDFITGVTTNPQLLAKVKNPLKTIEKILLLTDGPVAVQVVAETAQQMIRQGEELQSISPHIIVKVPVTKEGLRAIQELNEAKIRTMGTIIFNARQALLAALAGANYVAPYLSRMQQEEPNVWSELKHMKATNENYQFPCKILAASIHNLEQFSICAQMGIPAITLKDHLFQELVKDHPRTLESLEIFNQEWEMAKFEAPLFNAQPQPL